MTNRLWYVDTKFIATYNIFDFNFYIYDSYIILLVSAHKVRYGHYLK